jgi:hypothetical protein
MKTREQLIEQARQASLEVWAEAQRKALHEAVKNTPVGPVAAATGAGLGTGSGGANVIPGLYGVADNGLIYNVGDFTNLPFDEQPFPNMPVVCNGGDGYLYAAVLFDGSGYFLRINIATGFTDLLDNDIDNFTQKGLASLYREPSGSFILVDNADKKSSVTNIIRITIDTSDFASASLVNSIDSSATGGFFLKQLTLVSDSVGMSVWATGILDDGFNTEIIGPFDIETGEYTAEPLVITAYKNGEPFSVDWIGSSVESNGVLYINALYDSGSATALFSVDKTTGNAAWIKDTGSPETVITIYNIFNI